MLVIECVTSRALPPVATDHRRWCGCHRHSPSCCKKNWCYFRTSHYLWSSFSCPFGFQSTAKERAKHAADYFTLLRHLLNYAFNSNINLPNAEVLLNNEIDWLKRIRVCSFKLLFGIKIVKTLVCKFEFFFCFFLGWSEEDWRAWGRRDHFGRSNWCHKRAISFPDPREKIPHWLWKRRC